MAAPNVSPCPTCGRELFEGRCLGTSARPGCAARPSPLALAAGATEERTAAIAALRGAVVRRAEDRDARRGFGTVLKPQVTVRSMLGMREPVLRIAWDDGTESRRSLSQLSVATPDELRLRDERRARSTSSHDAGVAAWEPSDAPAWCGRCGAALASGRCTRAGCPGPR